MEVLLIYADWLHKNHYQDFEFSRLVRLFGQIRCVNRAFCGKRLGNVISYISTQSKGLEEYYMGYAWNLINKTCGEPYEFWIKGSFIQSEDNSYTIKPIEYALVTGMRWSDSKPLNSWIGGNAPFVLEPFEMYRQTWPYYFPTTLNLCIENPPDDLEIKWVNVEIDRLIPEKVRDNGFHYFSW